MNRSLRAAAAALTAVGTMSAVPASFAVDNVADNGVPSITLNGVFGVLGPANVAFWTPPSAPAPVFAPPHTVVDGVFRGMFTTWTQGTVFWDATAPGAASNTIVINLDHAYAINQLLIEADSNEFYQVQYRSGASWIPVWNANPVPAYGLQTRASEVLPAPFVTDALRLVAIGGDGLYAVSELQAFGAPVPEPGTWAMLLAGFGMVGLYARRRLR